MSLFGTGRKEGVAAVCLIALLVGFTHVAVGRQNGTDGALCTALAGAVGGLSIYRFLRSQGRSRYAAFLAGIAYGLAPLLSGLALAPREQFAAAVAPWTLEAAWLCDRPSRRRLWLPLLVLALAAPFLFGATFVAAATAALALGAIARTVVFGDHSETGSPVGAFVFAAAAALTAAANLVWLDPLAPLLGAVTAPAAGEVLGAGASATTASVAVRALGPFLLWFALFGVLRRQRQVSTSVWLPLLLLGAAPTALALLPQASVQAALAAAPAALPATAWWLCLLAATVLGAAGLDDFLDMPQRRRAAQHVLLVLSLGVAPVWGALDPANAPLALWIVLATWALLALAATTWRRLGVLRFKNLLTALALLTFVAPLLLPNPTNPPLPAAPLGEVAATSWSMVGTLLLARPWWHAAGVATAVLASLLLLGHGAFARRRRARG